LLILDVKLPTHGILTIGGIACFIIGGLMLVDTRYSWVGRMSWQIVVAMAILVGGFFAVAIGAAIKAHLRKPTTGKEGMLGAMGKVTAALSEDEEGEVAVAGELWRARSKQGNIAPGEKVEVVGLEGLTLIVQPAVKE
jgi:membrane-bound serine protease (ClpP class)